jgi:hypothetical protein
MVVPRAQHRDVVDAVQKGNDSRVANAVGWRKLERGDELRRLGRHPQNVDVSVEQRRGRDLYFELSERDALDAEPSRMSGKRLDPQEQHDGAPSARERAADKTADTAGTEDRMSHTHDRKPGNIDAALAGT